MSAQRFGKKSKRTAFILRYWIPLNILDSRTVEYAHFAHLPTPFIYKFHLLIEDLLIQFKEVYDEIRQIS